jgi:putative oxidoreductase
MSLIASFGPLVGRILMALLFAFSGWHKLAAPGRTAASLAALHIPVPTAAAVGAGAVEVLGAVALALGFRTRAAALVLFLYVLAATLLFHWPNEMTQVLKNLAIMGGLLVVAGHGPGPVSVNR